MWCERIVPSSVLFPIQPEGSKREKTPIRQAWSQSVASAYSILLNEVRLVRFFELPAGVLWEVNLSWSLLNQLKRVVSNQSWCFRKICSICKEKDFQEKAKTNIAVLRVILHILTVVGKAPWQTLELMMTIKCQKLNPFLPVNVNQVFQILCHFDYTF